MKQVLIVEDEVVKADDLVAFFESRNPAYATTVAKSFHSALGAVLTSSFDLLVLDMSLPTYDPTPTEPGGRPRPFGGREILHKLRRRSLRVPAVVVTQFDEFGKDRVAVDVLAKELEAEFVDNYRGLVFYDGRTASWIERLGAVIVELESEWAIRETS